MNAAWVTGKTKTQMWRVVLIKSGHGIHQCIYKIEYLELRGYKFVSLSPAQEERWLIGQFTGSALYFINKRNISNRGGF